MRAQLSFILLQITRLTDRQTDGRTDGILIARPRLHSMQRGKKTYFNVALDAMQYYILSHAVQIVYFLLFSTSCQLL